MELPFAVEGDRCGGLSIKLMFNKHARWTKALKLMAADLKWCLSWVVQRESSLATLHTFPSLA